MNIMMISCIRMFEFCITKCLAITVHGNITNICGSHLHSRQKSNSKLYVLLQIFHRSFVTNACRVARKVGCISDTEMWPIFSCFPGV